MRFNQITNPLKQNNSDQKITILPAGEVLEGKNQSLTKLKIPE
jgi:hypothetical protein